MKARGTTTGQVDQTMSRVLASIKSRVDPTYERTYRCPGGCEDTGWVEVDDGLEDGKRVRSPSVRRCQKCSGPAPKKSQNSRERDFS